MKDVKKVFKNLEEILRSSSWFNDGWEIYNRGPYLQLYREDWFNQNQGGVHFETFIEANQVRDKVFQSPCMQKRIALPKNDLCNNSSNWKVDESAAGKATKRSVKATLFVSDAYLNFKNLEQRILEEFNRLRKLEASVAATFGRLGV